MKNALALLALLALVPVPAFAEEGAVPRATLVSLGLSDLQTISDAQGMQVRGQATYFSRVRGTTVVVGQLYDPSTDTAYPFGPLTATVDETRTIAGVHGFSHSVTIPGSWSVSNLPAFSGTIGGTAWGFGTISIF